MHNSRFHSPPSRLLMLTCVCAAIVFGMATTVQAGALAPGTKIANDGVAANTSGGGALLADTGYVFFDFGSGSNTGFIRNIVISDPSNALGGLTFMYHITGTAGDMSSVNVSSFINGGAWKTDASAVSTAIQNPLLPALTPLFVPSTTANGVLDAANAKPISRSGSGEVVGFAYDKLVTTAPYSSLVMIVRTDAPEYSAGGNQSIQDGFSGNVPSFQPAPEPASMTLLGIGLVSLGGYALRRRKGVRTEETETPAV